MQCPASSLYIFIGAAPKTEWLPEGVLRDEQGFILAGPDLRKNGNCLQVGQRRVTHFCWKPVFPASL